jgi:hypothetical protein
MDDDIYPVSAEHGVKQAFVFEVPVNQRTPTDRPLMARSQVIQYYRLTACP